MEAPPGINADALSRELPRSDAGSGTGATPSLFDRMRREGFRFDFYQAVRLLEQRARKHGAHGGSPTARRATVWFRPASELSFPAADVKRIDPGDTPVDAATVTATFMGLYGVDSPLPDYFYDRIAVDEASATDLRDFLDIFSHRLYAFFYRAWKRVRPDVDDGRHARRFLAVAGLAHAPSDPQQPIAPADLVPFAGRLAPRARGAEGLSNLVQTILELPTRVEQYVPRWVQVNRSGGLGRGARLDGGLMLGERVFDVSGKFRIWLGPMDLEHYLALLPGGEDARVLRWVVRAHVPGYLDHDVALQLYTERLPKARLGDKRCLLGLTMCLGTPAVKVLTRIVR